MDRIDTGRPGVAEFRDVPLVGGAAHRAGAYLHLAGLSRDRGSALVRAFLLMPGSAPVEVGTGPDDPRYLGEGAVYLSPTGDRDPTGQGAYDLQVDVSRALEALAPPGPTVDLALTIRDAAGSPVDTSGFQIGRLEITRR